MLAVFGKKKKNRLVIDKFAITTYAVIWLNSTLPQATLLLLLFTGIHLLTPEKTPDQDWERSVRFLLMFTARLLPVSFFFPNQLKWGGK